MENKNDFFNNSFYKINGKMTDNYNKIVEKMKDTTLEQKIELLKELHIMNTQNNIIVDYFLKLIYDCDVSDINSLLNSFNEDLYLILISDGRIKMILEKGIGYKDDDKYKLCTPYFFNKIKMLDKKLLIYIYRNEEMIFYFYKSNPLKGLILSSSFNLSKFIDDYIKTIPSKIDKNKILKIFGNYLKYGNLDIIEKLYHYIKNNGYKYGKYDKNIRYQSLVGLVLNFDVDIFKKIYSLMFTDNDVFSIE